MQSPSQWQLTSFLITHPQAGSVPHAQLCPSQHAPGERLPQREPHEQSAHTLRGVTTLNAISAKRHITNAIILGVQSLRSRLFIVHLQLVNSDTVISA